MSETEMLKNENTLYRLKVKERFFLQFKQLCRFNLGTCAYRCVTYHIFDSFREQIY
ncbi:hypothetical protein CHS0354_008305, partial [Potamilus streckersoni]